MATLHIRDLPQEVYDAPARRAERRSVAQQAVVELAGTAEVRSRERRLEILAEIRRRLETSGPRALPVPPGTLVREDRDR